MTPLRSLVAALARDSWNRGFRKAGVGSRLALSGVVTIASLALLVPAVFCALFGYRLGSEAGSQDLVGDTALRLWSLQQIAFVVIVGTLGGFRHQLRISWQQVGRFPLERTRLLLAELPGSLLEALPLLAATGILATHIGWMLARPAWSPLLLGLALLAILRLLLLQHLAGSLKRWSLRWPYRAALVAATVLGLGWLALIFFSAPLAPMTAVIAILNEVVVKTPGALAYKGLLDLMRGELVTGIQLLLPSVAFTGLLLAVVAHVHSRELRIETQRSRWGASLLGFGSFSSPREGIGRLLFSEVLSSNRGRTLLFAPVFALWIVAFVLGFFGPASTQGPFSDPWIRGWSQGLETLPWVGLLLTVISLMNHEMWLNQFGWSGSGIRSLLALPISGEDLLAGKLNGLIRLHLLQALAALPPLLWLQSPGPAELAWGVAAGFITIVTTGAIGHELSARYPRPVSKGGNRSGNFPIHMAWIPMAIVLAVAVFLRGAYALFALLGSWGPAVGLPFLALGFGLVYRALLPGIAQQVFSHRERLLSSTRS